MTIPFVSVKNVDGPEGQERLVGALEEAIEDLPVEVGSIVGDFEYLPEQEAEYFGNVARHVLRATGSDECCPDFADRDDPRTSFVSWFAGQAQGFVPVQVVEVDLERVVRRMLVVPASIDVAAVMDEAGVDVEIVDLAAAVSSASGPDAT